MEWDQDSNLYTEKIKNNMAIKKISKMSATPKSNSPKSTPTPGKRVVEKKVNPYTTKPVVGNKTYVRGGVKFIQNSDGTYRKG
jgi:hypothetical protein